ncbi:sigma-54 interaction domain-containing protein [Sedimentibacter sp. MB31-C6]|uniref:sigma-54 interaction domain-containing protein n=1 Tax=Sedimentibacter sp. MB31-C6 TaxID=3109366 RepID=UPI002DDD9454|nr:sigma-54 dependent transcriptional regulator [Sedimentibacter sp. MB36-C1]WSI03541.1 sigma-54 dependent transcriptional regulator [Sedimentibacter sp. MB36-C1]
MKNANIDLIIDSDLKIREISIAALDLVKPEYQFYLGYKSDRFQISDVIIIVENHYSKNKEIYTKEFIHNLNIDYSESMKERFIIVGAYKDSSIQAIYKDNFSNESLKTVFNGQEISIATTDESVFLQIDDTNYNIELSKWDNQVIALNSNQIKFFINPNIKFKEDLLEYFYLGSFNEFINYKKDIIIGLDVEQIFNNDLINNLKEFFNSKESQMIFTYKGESIYLVKKTLLVDEKKVISISIFTKKMCINEIDSYGNVLKSLEKFEAMNTQTPCLNYINIIGNSPEIRLVEQLLDRAARTNVTIMLLGESGTGKTLFAKEIHNKSKRKNNPFIHVNCAAIPKELIESELFGYEEGAFTGAKKGGKKGYFEIANKGTVFLDEIAELPMESQSRLLEVLQSKTYYRVGGQSKIYADFRIVAATNKDLKELVETNLLRKDLYYRLNVFSITIPPLRERGDDISLLCKSLLPKICKNLEIESLLISDEVLQRFSCYHWPGNVRELENILECAAILCEGRVIQNRHIMMIENEFTQDIHTTSLKQRVDSYEKQIIYDSLRLYKNKIKTAEKLGIGRTTLFEKMKKYDLEF